VRPVVVAAPVYTWTGFYVGGNAGYSWGTLSNNWNLFAQSIVLAGCPPAGVAFCETGSDVTRLNGALGGLQAGYNWQTGNFLAGIETDLQLANQRGSNVLNFPAQAVTGGPPPTFPAATVAYNEKLSWLGTVRARLGLTADRWVVYGTGGLAYGSVKNSGSVASSCGTGGASSFPCTVANWDDHVTKIGWTLGAGIEAAFSGAWSLKVEYLHVDFGTVNTTFAIPPNPCFFIGVTECSATVAGTGTINSRITDDIVRVGINYKFGNYATPAVYK
jgi:outer membrane immunogenic protein